MTFSWKMYEISYMNLQMNFRFIDIGTILREIWIQIWPRVLLSPKIYWFFPGITQVISPSDLTLIETATNISPNRSNWNHSTIIRFEWIFDKNSTLTVAPISKSSEILKILYFYSNIDRNLFLLKLKTLLKHWLVFWVRLNSILSLDLSDISNEIQFWKN